MKKSKKIILIISLIIFCAGLAMSTVSACMINFDFSQLDTNEYVVKKKDISEDFSNIDIHTVSMDITFERSSDNACHVEYTESSSNKFKVDLKDGTLHIDSESDNWVIHAVNYFNFSFLHNKVTVYLPDKDYRSLDISTVSGDIAVNGFSFGNVKLGSTSGDISFSSQCASLDINTTSGKIDVKDIADGKDLSVNTVSGDLNISGCRFTETSVHTTSGDISIDKTAPGKGSITTVSGDVNGKLVGDYEINTNTVSGDVDVADSRKGAPRIDIHTTSGDISIEKD